MKKINCALTFFASMCLLSGCGDSQETVNVEKQKVDILGKADPKSAMWIWEKDGSNYNAKLYLTYYLDENDLSGKEVCYDIVPTRTVITPNTCTEDGLDRYVASFVVDGVTLSSQKDVETYAKGHHFDKFVDNGETHYKVCECGLGDYENETAHNYIDDGNNMTKTCDDCFHQTFTDEYLANKITNIKNSISKLVVPSSLENAIDNLGTNLIAKSILEALELEDIDKLSSDEFSKLVKVLYNYRTLIDANSYHSYKLPTLVIDPKEIGESIVKDEILGYVKTFDVKETISSRLVNSREDLEPVANPDSGIGEDYYMTVFNTIEIPTFPNLNNGTREIGFKLYVPEDNMQYRFLSYTSYPTSKYEYKTQMIDLNKGWNYIGFSDLAIFNDVTHLFIELRNKDNGTLPKGEYKVTSLLGRFDDISKVEEEIEALPSKEEIKINSYEKVLNMYQTLSEIDVKISEAISNKNKLLELNDIVKNHFSLPYGSSINITNNQNLSLLLPNEKINDASMYRISVSGTNFDGCIKATEVIPCSNETLGFLTYQAGDNCYGSKSSQHIVLYSNDWTKTLVTTTSLHIEGGWYLHYIPTSQIKEYLTEGAKTIWSANYIRFGVLGIPSTGENPNKVYISTLYSFDTSIL